MPMIFAGSVIGDPSDIHFLDHHYFHALWDVTVELICWAINVPEAISETMHPIFCPPTQQLRSSGAFFKMQTWLRE